MLSKKAKVLSQIEKTGTVGLEIGPSHNPMAPKREGYCVEILDCLSQEGLIQKYETMGIDTSQIEPVDFLWSGESYADLTGKRKHYDWIIASHAIEHVPDLIQFLNDCDEVLKDDGVLSLVVPDKRYCFDRFRPITGIGKIVDAHCDRRQRHTPGTLAEFFLQAASKDGLHSWGGDAPGRFEFIHTLAQARSILDHVRNTDEYIDTHAWCFVPHSFRLLIRDLNALGLIALKELSFFDTEGCEFFMTLSRRGMGPGRDRLALMQQIDRELAVVAAADRAGDAPEMAAVDPTALLAAEAARSRESPLRRAKRRAKRAAKLTWQKLAGRSSS